MGATRLYDFQAGDCLIRNQLRIWPFVHNTSQGKNSHTAVIKRREYRSTTEPTKVEVFRRHLTTQGTDEKFPLK